MICKSRKNRGGSFVSISIIRNWQNFGLSKIAPRYSELDLIKTVKIKNLYARVDRNVKKSISLFNSLKCKKNESNKNFFVTKKIN